MCRYTPRKIRVIAATSWKQKDWLAPATLPAFSSLPGKQNPRTRRKRPARAITGVQLDGGRKDRSGVPHHGTHTRKCALNFEIIGTLARPQPSATIRIRNRQPTRSSHCYLYITSIELGYFSDHRRLRPQSRAGFAFAIAWWTRENISFLDRSSTSALDSGIYIYRFLSSFESRHLHSNRPAQVERRCHAGKFTHL